MRFEWIVRPLPEGGLLGSVWCQVTNFIVQKGIEQCQNCELSCSCNHFAPLIVHTRFYLLECTI